MLARRPLLALGMLATLLTACSPAARVTATTHRAATLPEGTTPAFRDVVARHARELAAVPDTAVAGLRLLQDAAGQRLASGVLSAFPTEIADDKLTAIIPGSAGRQALGFGFARTGATRVAGPVPVVYVTVAGTAS